MVGYGRVLFGCWFAKFLVVGLPSLFMHKSMSEVWPRVDSAHEATVELMFNCNI